MGPVERQLQGQPQTLCQAGATLLLQAELPQPSTNSGLGPAASQRRADSREEGAPSHTAGALLQAPEHIPSRCPTPGPSPAQERVSAPHPAGWGSLAVPCPVQGAEASGQGVRKRRQSSQARPTLHTSSRASGHTPVPPQRPRPLAHLSQATGMLSFARRCGHQEGLSYQNPSGQHGPGWMQLGPEGALSKGTQAWRRAVGLSSEVSSPC